MSGAEPTLFYKRTVTPGINLADHARGLGIHLKSNRLTQFASPRKGIASPRSRTSALTTRNAKSCPPSVVGGPRSEYIEDVVVPLAAKTDEQNVKNSVTPRPFSAHEFTPRIKPKSEKRAKSSLPHMTQTQHNTHTNIPNNSPRSSAKSIRTLSTFLEKYNVSSAPLEQTFLTKSGSNDQRKWNASEQAQRFDSEQRKREKGRVLKRTSEIKPHRIDRMYYMSGTQVSLSAKYDIDEAELERLKSLSQARQDSRHYGRGLSSHRGDRYNPDIGDKEPPHQPPPSSLSHNPDQAPIVPDGTIVNQEKETTIDDDNITTGRTRPSTGVTNAKSEKIDELQDKESTKEDDATKEAGQEEASPAVNGEADGETELNGETEQSQENATGDESKPTGEGETEAEATQNTADTENLKEGDNKDSSEEPVVNANAEESQEPATFITESDSAEKAEKSETEQEQSGETQQEDSGETPKVNGLEMGGETTIISVTADENQTS